MFGGFGLFSDKTVFAFVAEQRLCIRANESKKKCLKSVDFSPFLIQNGRVGLSPLITSYLMMY
ncbi:TfoX/Sxy family protein [Vibrio splendidus]|uniref:TfoX/Sxy family protein n=1 Tax=Vibrio splendidus TaxID=29497 RepID=UPI0039A559D3